jgi:flagellar hook-associated protein 1 FlgK
MANGFGSLYVGSSGLRTAQNGINTLSNNLANLGTAGYVRQKVIYEDTYYNKFGSAAVSDQQAGLGVGIGDVIHARDIFLDQAYRTQSGRAAFYNAGYDAASEVETQLQEIYGQAFQGAITSLYSAFAEFAKNPSDTVNQNLVIQKCQLFLSRANGVNDGLREYQMTINTKIKNDVTRVNELGKDIVKLNKDIQRIEAGDTDTAMALRDQRDLDLDELSSLANITYREDVDGTVQVRLEGNEFINEVQYNTMSIRYDNTTGFAIPYWPGLSDVATEKYYDVYDIYNVDPLQGTDNGEIKSLMLARGEGYGNYTDITGITSEQYDSKISNSIVMNSQAELDKLVNTIVSKVNDLLCPNVKLGTSVKSGNTSIDLTAAGTKIYDETGKQVTLSADTLVLDSANCAVGADGKLPPQELFTRVGTDRYKKYTVTDGTNSQDLYIYQEEDSHDLSKSYTLKSLSVNYDLTENPQHIPNLTQNGSVDYTMGQAIYNLWEVSDYTLNPSDNTPTTLTGFYTKFIGELSSAGSVYKSTANSLTGTKDTIESNRQAVIGVSSDEELTNMIKYQNAYNASSRYINVVNQMIEYMVTSMFSS